MTQQELEIREPAGTPEPSGLAATLLRVAWLAILLGLAMEALLLVMAGAAEGPGPEVAADLVRNVSWSVFVCVGLAVGTAVARARVAVMGLLGLLAAPVALEVSRALHKGTLQALTMAGGAETGDVSPLLLAVFKGIEYGILGVLIGWVGGRPWGGLAAHLSAGFTVGVIFGGAMLALTVASAPQPVSGADLLSRAANEILFPVGCALVLFSARSLDSRVVSGD